MSATTDLYPDCPAHLRGETYRLLRDADLRVGLLVASDYLRDGGDEAGAARLALMASWAAPLDSLLWELARGPAHQSGERVEEGGRVLFSAHYGGHGGPVLVRFGGGRRGGWGSDNGSVRADLWVESAAYRRKRTAELLARLFDFFGRGDVQQQTTTEEGA